MGQWKSIRSVITSFFLMLLGISTLGQELKSVTIPSKVINLNDNTKLRIYDGHIVDDNYVIHSFENIKYLGRLDAEALGLNSDKPILLINSFKSEIETEILIKLFSQKKFLKEFKFPLDTRLPIAINNVQLTKEEREVTLSKTKMKDIRYVKYLDKDKASIKYRDLPFGVIEIGIKK